LKAVKSRKLGIWGALPNYIGGKRRICAVIFREIDRLLPRRNWRGLTFLDGFLGGGSVSIYAKAQGFHVTACDVAERAMVVGEALIANSRVRLAREDVLRLLVPNNLPAGRVERELAPSTFTCDQARFIDRALALAEATGDKAKAALFRLLAIRVAQLAHPLSQVRGGTIHRISSGDYESITESCLHQYISGLRLTHSARLWAIAQQINAGIFEGHGLAIRGSILDVLPTINAAVFYADPPYANTLGYEKAYRVIDEMLEGSARSPSPFTARDGASLLDTLFESAQHIPIWILSFGNAVITIEELASKMTRLGRQTRTVSLHYKHMPALAGPEKRRSNREFLVVGWDQEALERLMDGQGITARLDHPHAVAQVHVDASSGSAEPSPFVSGFHDGEESTEASFHEEVALLAGEAVPEVGGDVNDPGALQVEASLDRNLEGRVLGRVSLRHDPTFTDPAADGQACTEETK